MEHIFNLWPYDVLWFSGVETGGSVFTVVIFLQNKCII
jgi:hypothetical protein